MIVCFSVLLRLGATPVRPVQSNSQGPFRLCQALRCIWGLGYSGWGFDLSTSAVHGVMRVRPFVSCHTNAWLQTMSVQHVCDAALITVS